MLVETSHGVYSYWTIKLIWSQQVDFFLKRFKQLEEKVKQLISLFNFSVTNIQQKSI